MTKERNKKAIKGTMMWIASNNVERVKSLSELVNRLVEYEKALLSIKSPSEKLIQSLKEEFNVYDSINALKQIDGLFRGNNEPSTPCDDSIVVGDDDGLVGGDGLGDDDTPTMAKSLEYLTDTSETQVTGFRQAEWVEPDYDGTTALNDAVLHLYGYGIKNTRRAGALTGEAKEALGMPVKGVLSTADKLRIYQWHVANKPTS